MEKIEEPISTFARIMIKELKDQGVDFESPNYVKSPSFIELKDRCFDYSLGLTVSWVVENLAVSQNVLNSVYGPLSMCARGYGKEFYSKKYLLDYIADSDRPEIYKDFFKNIPEGYDSDLYFFRKNGNKLGVKHKLKEWGVDVDLFDDKESELKLYFLIFLVEHHPVFLKKYNTQAGGQNKYLNIFKFLNNPTTENADRRDIGINSVNMEIIHFLKSETIKGISFSYAESVKKTFEKITEEWNILSFFLNNYMIKNPHYKKEDVYNALKELETFCDNFKRDSGYFGKRDNSLLETFYLKLREHEHVGIEQDFSLGIKYLNKLPKELNLSISNYVKISNREIDYDDVESLLKEKRKIYAGIIFSTENLTSNNYVKFERACEVVKEYLNLRIKNGAHPVISTTELEVLVCIDEFVRLSKNEKIDNGFFCHKSNEPRNLRKDVSKTDTAFGINQFAWFKYITYRIRNYYFHSDFDLEASIDLTISGVLRSMYTMNSLCDLMAIHTIFIDEACSIFEKFINFGVK